MYLVFCYGVLSAVLGQKNVSSKEFTIHGHQARSDKGIVGTVKGRIEIGRVTVWGTLLFRGKPLQEIGKGVVLFFEK